MLPYPVDYQPYTAYHISETLQILLFTGRWLLPPHQKAGTGAHHQPGHWIGFIAWAAALFNGWPQADSRPWITFVGAVYRVVGLIPLDLSIARLAGLFDNEFVIDGFVDGLASSVRGIGGRLRVAQRGAGAGKPGLRFRRFGHVDRGIYLRLLTRR